jgi:hypothetical protein
MTAISITPGYPTFADTDGSPLNDGYVYIGLEYQDPITAPTGAFWDKDFRIPADQPLRTSGGYVVRDGSPAAVYTGAAYSILVQNKNLVTVYNAPSAVITNVTNNVEEITQYQGAHATDPVARNDGTPLQTGDLYFNTVVNELKVWTGTVWVPAVPGTVSVENFTGTGAQTAFNLATAPVAENNTQIYIDGVYQQKDTYTLSGATINFSAAPPLNSTIEVVTFSISSLGTTDASNVSYNEGSAGAVNTSVQAKLQESVSVKDFGATGDGVTDDTAAINAAFAVGGKIYFPSGTYLCSTITLASSDTHIFGSKKSVIKLKNSVNVDLLDLSNFDNITISDLTFDGNKANQTVDVNAVCIRGNGCSNVILQNCTVKNSALTGANIINSDGIKIVNNLFTDCGTKNSVNSGDAMYLAFNTNDYVSGNTVVNPARIGIIIKGSAGPTATNGTVIGNYVINSGENGIGTEDGNARILIVNNVVVDSGDNAFASTKAGIAVGEVGEKVTVSGNIIHNSGSYGIEVTHGADETIVSNNSITSSGAMGIFATAVDGSGGLDNLVITGNNITTTVTDGIFISAALTNPLIAANLNTNISILSNVVRGAARDSIVCSAMLDFNVSNNTIHTTTTASGIRVINSEEGSVSDNYITEVASRGVYLQGAAINCNNVAVKNNTIIDAGTWGVFLIASDNASVMGNTIRNRTGATPTTVGVRSEGAGNANLIVNNDVRGIATGISSTVSGTADTTTPNFT